MKKNLVKILAIASIALVAGACRGKKKSEDPYKEVVINELFELEADGKFKLEGQLVRLKNQCIYGNYGTTYVAGVDYDSAEDARDYKGFEVELSAHPDWKGETKGRYANVDVTGKLVNVNGRPVLQEGAVETIHAEAQYDADGNRVDNDGAFSAGLWAKSGMKRSTWDTYFDRGNSGALLAGIFQIASVPSAAVAGDAESEFYVTFPGENLDTSDPDNDSLIPVTFPKGLNEAAVTAANKFLEGKKAGDFMDVYALSYYDSVKGGTCLMLENWWTKYAKTPDKADTPVILHSWAEVVKEIKDFYDDSVIDLAGATIDDDSNPETPEVPDPADKLNAPFSYLIDDSNVDKNPRDLWVDAYKDKLVKVSEPDKCGTVEITANIKASDMDAYYDALKAKMTDAAYMGGNPFVCDESAAQTEGYVIFTQTIESKVVRQLLVMAGSSQSYSLYYTALKASLTYSAFNDWKAQLQAKAAVKGEEITGAAFTYNTALVDFPEANRPTGYTLTWMFQGYFASWYANYGELVMRYDFSFKFAAGKDLVAIKEAYISGLLGSGFSLAYSKYIFGGSIVLANPTSKEIVALFVDSEENAIAGYVLPLNDLAATEEIMAPTAGDTAAATLNSGYAYYASAAPTLFGAEALGASGVTGFGSLTIGENAVTHWAYNPDTSAASVGMLAFSVGLKYSAAITTAQFEALLTAAGFVKGAACAVLGIEGAWWNNATHEFVDFQVDGSFVDITLMWCNNSFVSSYLTLPTA